MGVSALMLTGETLSFLQCQTCLVPAHGRHRPAVANEPRWCAETNDSCSALSRNVGSLRKAAAERGVLAGDLVEQHHQICRRNLDRRHDLLVERLQECQSRLLRSPGDKCQLEQNHVIRAFLAKKGRRMAIAIARQDMMDLKEVVGWGAENLD